MLVFSHRFAQGLGDGFHPGRSRVFHQVSKVALALVSLVGLPLCWSLVPSGEGRRLRGLVSP